MPARRTRAFARGRRLHPGAAAGQSGGRGARRRRGCQRPACRLLHAGPSCRKPLSFCLRAKPRVPRAQTTSCVFSSPAASCLLQATDSGQLPCLARPWRPAPVGAAHRAGMQKRPGGDRKSGRLPGCCASARAAGPSRRCSLPFLQPWASRQARCRPSSSTTARSSWACCSIAPRGCSRSILTTPAQSPGAKSRR